MLDHSHKTMQRAKGRAMVRLSQTAGRVRLQDLHQSGCAKVFLPQIHAPVPEVVFLNTAGGVTGGDRLGYELNVGDDAKATGTTQTAERAYASSGGTGEITVDLRVGENASLDWLPQETILFNHCSVARRSTVTLAPTARFLMAETVVLGRKAMGEQLQSLAFHDVRHVSRAGRPEFVEPLQINDRTIGASAGSAVFGNATAMTTIAFMAQGAEDAVEALRNLHSDPEVALAASGWDGKCILRLLAQDSWPLRKAVAKLVTHLRGQPMPRVWQM